MLRKSMHLWTEVEKNYDWWAGEKLDGGGRIRLEKLTETITHISQNGQ